MKALGEIGLRRAARFGFLTLAMVPYRALLFPQLRAPYLRLLGAHIGKRTILHGVRFFNLYRRGLPGLSIGNECFLGDECLLDLAESIVLEDQVTLAGKVAFDAATFGSVIGRLEAKGWVRREPDAADRRRKLLWITPEGEEAAVRMKRAVGKAQARILGPLDSQEREQLVALLGKLVAGHQPG